MKYSELFTTSSGRKVLAKGVFATIGIIGIIFGFAVFMALIQPASGQIIPDDCRSGEVVNCLDEVEDGIDQVGDISDEFGLTSTKWARALGAVKSSTEKKEIGIVLANSTESPAEVLIKFPDAESRRVTVPPGGFKAPDNLTFKIRRGTNRFSAKTLWSSSGDFAMSEYDREFEYDELNEISAIPFVLRGERGDFSVESGGI